jgi:hypothetical protein
MRAFADGQLHGVSQHAGDCGWSVPLPRLPSCAVCGLPFLRCPAVPLTHCAAQPRSRCTDVWVQLENTRQCKPLAAACAAKGGATPGRLKLGATRLSLRSERPPASSANATRTPAVFVQLLLDCCELPLKPNTEPPAPSSATSTPRGTQKPQAAYIYCVVSVGSESKPSWVIAETSKAVFSQAFEFVLAECLLPPSLPFLASQHTHATHGP